LLFLKLVRLWHLPSTGWIAPVLSTSFVPYYEQQQQKKHQRELKHLLDGLSLSHKQ
jgi:hypothetical protein